MSVINLHNGHGSGSELSDANSCCDLDVNMEEVHDIVDNGKQKFKCEYRREEMFAIIISLLILNITALHNQN